MLYMFTTLFLFLFGPWVYDNHNLIGMLAYLISFALISSFAFKRGVCRSLKYYGIDKNNCEDEKTKCDNKYGNRLRRLKILILAFLIVSVAIFGICVATNGLPSGGNIIANMANAYSNVQSTIVTTRDLPLWIFENFSFIIYFAIILGFSFFKSLPNRYKTLLVVATGLLVMYFMLYRGQQKQLGDIIIIMASALLINFSWQNKKINITKKMKIIILVVFVVLFFSMVLSGRLIMMNKTIYSLSHGSNSMLNPDSILFKILPEGISLGIAFFIFYISHGYQGLVLSLEQPFVWTRFLGSASALTTLLERYLHIDTSILNQTYPMRTQLATGWSETATWHTIFPWLASDFTFVGAIVILSIGAYMYGICWVECIIEKKWQSIILFTVFNIQWFYMVANNQLFTLKSTLMVVIFAVFFWAIRRIKFKFGNITL